ncbi:hypothetical protein FRC06_004165 [Ceratobasidium sp. 370]|nr:hypothetical protein FRC06_004165 [Ceratobasidium sp. 370]
MSDEGPKDILHLNFFVYGDNPMFDVYSISTSRATLIQKFGRDLRDLYKRQTGKKIMQYYLFKIDVSQAQLRDLEPPLESFLQRYELVSDHWPAGSEIVAKNVHVLVRAEGPPSGDTLTELLSELSIQQKKTKDTIRRGASASLISKASNFKAQQEDKNGTPSPTHNGRPRLKTGLPVELYHPVFSDFIRDTQLSKKPEPFDLRTIEDLLLSAQALYDVEDNRKLEMYRYLGMILDAQVAQQAIKNNGDHVILSRYSKSMSLSGYCAIVGAKNEIGTGDCDPSVQGAESYGRYWSQDMMDGFRAASCCPSFIIAIAGPWLCILGAVYVEQVVVQPLTDFMWMGRQPHEEGRLRRLTQIFVALREAIRHLDGYYQSLPGPTMPHLAQFFPYIRRYQDTSFQYIRCLATDPVRPVFLAQTESGDPIVVKFVQQYSIEAHRILMEQELAPSLLYDSATPLDCGMRMIVMRYVSGGNLDIFLHEYPKDKRGAAIKPIYADVDKALSLLHASDLVFGDLRPPNVLVVKRKTGIGAMLIDFDWCSKAQEGHYPLGLNDSMPDTWATGMERGGTMEKMHDREMMELLFK